MALDKIAIERAANIIAYGNHLAAIAMVISRPSGNPHRVEAEDDPAA